MRRARGVAARVGGRQVPTQAEYRLSGARARATICAGISAGICAGVTGCPRRARVDDASIAGSGLGTSAPIARVRNRRRVDGNGGSEARVYASSPIPDDRRVRRKSRVDTTGIELVTARVLTVTCVGSGIGHVSRRVRAQARQFVRLQQLHPKAATRPYQESQQDPKKTARRTHRIQFYANPNGLRSSVNSAPSLLSTSSRSPHQPRHQANARNRRKRKPTHTHANAAAADADAADADAS